MRQRRSDTDEDVAFAEGAYGWRLIKRIALAAVFLALALILVSFGVPGAAVVALAALAALLVLLWLGPWLGPHRRKL